tara:strand:- start:205 stop:1905 length:1701 start_codon:yes stop_codon:yes gene_type:complete
VADLTITSRDELEAWLQDKPREWARVIALRAALRVLPHALDPSSYSRASDHRALTFACLRALAVSSGIHKIPADDTLVAAAAAAAFDAVYAVTADGMPDITTSSASAYAAVASVSEASASAAARAAEAAAEAAAEVTAAAYTSGAAIASDSACAGIWTTFSHDCVLLSEKQVSIDRLLAMRLWPTAPVRFVESWKRGRDWMLQSNEGFAIWAEWCERRIEGKSAFPGFDDTAESAFYRYLFDRDDGWWKRGPAKVNRDIAAKVAELRGTAEPTAIEPQDLSAVVFRTSEEGKAELDRRAGNDRLSKDKAARRLHAVALSRVDGAGDTLKDNNNAPAFGPICKNLRAAIGGSLEETEPHVAVLEAQSLRDALDVQQAYGKGDDFQPLEGEQLRLVKAAINALNLWIGSDAFLEEIDTKVAGPDAIDIASPADVRALADATRGEVTTLSADRVLRLTADNAPEVSDRNNRKTGLMMRVGLNLVRWAISVVVDHERELLAAVGGGVVVGVVTAPVLTLGAAAGGTTIAWNLAKNIKNNEQIWRRIAQQARVTSANFDKLIEKIKALPLE